MGTGAASPLRGEALLGVGLAVAAEAAGLGAEAEGCVVGAGTAQTAERAASAVTLARQADRNEVMSTGLPEGQH